MKLVPMSASAVDRHPLRFKVKLLDHSHTNLKHIRTVQFSMMYYALLLFFFLCGRNFRTSRSTIATVTPSNDDIKHLNSSPEFWFFILSKGPLIT